MGYMLGIIKIFVIVLVGSYTKEFIDIQSSSKDTKVHLVKIFICTIGATIILYGMSEILITRYGPKFFIVINYITGLGSYKLIKRLTDVKMESIFPFIKSFAKDKEEEDKGDDDNG